MNSLEDADEVRTLPPLQKMPTRNALSTKTSRVSTRRCILAKSQFPGLLTTSKPATRKLHSESSEERKEPIWQAPCHFTNLKLDAISRISYAADITSSQDQFVGQPVKSSLAVINFGSPSSSGRKEAYQLDHMANTRNSLANFTEKYGPSQFIIYRGSLLSSTPEFQNYRSSYSRNWNAIAAVIRELEEFLRAEQVTLAIIDGIRVSEIASTNPTAGVFKEDLIACISNIDEIRMSSSFFFDRETSGQLQNRAAVKIQATTRKFIAVKRYKMRLLRNFCAVLIQCHVRRMIAVHSTRGRLLEAKSSLDLRWGNNVEKLKISWTKATTTDMSSSSFTIGLTRGNQSNIGTMTSKSPMTKNQIRLLIYIPSISSAECIRLFTDRFRAIQNMHIACLYQLVDPHVQVVYVSPVQLSAEEVAYHESFLQLLGVPPSSAGVKRLHFIVPEMIDKLPPHMSLSQVLWCSSGALKKIRNLIRLMPNAVIVPTSLSWVEKRLSHHLNVPMLSPDPTIATTITSRSFSMGIFDEACVNTPQGSRDIYSSTDFYVALSSLITSSIDVKRWMFRLNGDNNNESYAYLDVDKLSVAASLRSEIASIVQTKQGGAWYSKRMQLEVRKRVMYALRSELPSKVTICRNDIHGGSWEHFEKHYRAVGLVIDAESNDVTGYVQGLCFIDPNGIVQVSAPHTEVMHSKEIKLLTSYPISELSLFHF